MRAILLLAAAMSFAACTQGTKGSVDNKCENGETDSSVSVVADSDSIMTADEYQAMVEEEAELGEIYESNKSLNEIRFANWSESDNYDNGYFHEIRNFLNGNKGERNYDISEIEEQPKGKFMVHSIEAAMMGGLMVNIFFTDHPKDVYSVWVYSFVDGEKEKVIGYEVRYFEPVGEQDMTEEDVKDILLKMPMMRVF